MRLLARPGRTFRRGTSLLLATMLMVASTVAPALDVGFVEAEVTHIESPAAFAGHGLTHNHLLCAVLASTPGLPCVVRAIAARPGAATAAVRAPDATVPVSSVRLHDRARSPPIS